MSNDEWRTPPKIFKLLDDEFHFTLDVASTDKNTLCEKHFTKEQDGLHQSWGKERVFCNPPYSDPGPWLQKAAFFEDTEVTVVLIANDTSTKYYHKYVRYASEIRILRPRIKFNDENGNPAKGSPKFGSSVIIFRPVQPEPVIRFVEVPA